MLVLRLVLLLTSLVVSSLAADSITFGVIEIQMLSKSDSSTNDFLYHVLSQTGNFLEEVLQVEFGGTDYQFSHVSLGVNDYGLEKTTAYDAFVHLQGTAVFNEGFAPNSVEEVRTMVEKTFREQNSEYLMLLRATPNPFYNDLSFVLVSVNGDVVAQTGEAESTSTWPAMPVWMIATIAGASLVGFLIFLCVICYCYLPSRNHKAPTQKPSVQTAGSSEDDDEYDLAIAGSKLSPSPLHSIMSQDSSAFTFNPSSRGSNDGKGFFGNVTNSSQVDVDIEAWQQGSTINKDSSTSAPFGQDISAIETKKDLSLIEEGDEDPTPPHFFFDGSTLSSGSRLTTTAVAELEKQSRRKRINLNGSAAAVIDDLNDLSAQIDDYRRR